MYYLRPAFPVKPCRVILLPNPPTYLSYWLAQIIQLDDHGRGPNNTYAVVVMYGTDTFRVTCRDAVDICFL